VNGHWDRIVPEGPVEGRHQKVSLTAKLLADWTPTGSVKWMFHFPGSKPTINRIDQVTCIETFGTVAWLGTVTVGPPGNPFIGSDRVWLIVDEPKGSPDQVFFSRNFSAEDCHWLPDLWHRLLPLDRGEIQITQPGLNAYTESISFPFDMTVWIPCALDGAGEAVYLTGALHSVWHWGEDESGGWHATSHFQPQGLSGIGQTSGDTYQGTGVTRWSTNFNVFPYNDTYVNNYRMIGQGPGNNFTVHETYHITINANGELTAEVANFRVACQ
jgi:hypothetical protein